LPLLPQAHEAVPYHFEGGFPAFRFPLFALQSYNRQIAVNPVGCSFRDRGNDFGPLGAEAVKLSHTEGAQVVEWCREQSVQFEIGQVPACYLMDNSAAQGTERRSRTNRPIYILSPFSLLSADYKHIG
jgi:hypothetical protein